MVKIVERVELATQDFDEAFAGAGLLRFLSKLVEIRPGCESGLGVNMSIR